MISTPEGISIKNPIAVYTSENTKKPSERKKCQFSGPFDVNNKTDIFLLCDYRMEHKLIIKVASLCYTI